MNPEALQRPYAQKILAELAEAAARPEPKRVGSRTAVSARLARGRRESVKATGRHSSGPTPYGYQRDDLHGLAPRKGEADVVRLIFREYLRLRSFRLVLEALHPRVTRSGKPWSRSGLAWILRGEVYIAMTHYAGIRRRAPHLPLVTLREWQRAAKLMARNAKRRRGG